MEPSSLTPETARVAAHHQESLEAAMAVDGALAVAIVDSSTGSVLASRGPEELDLSRVAADYSTVVSAMHRTMADVGRSDHVEDVLVTFRTEYHVVRMFDAHPEIFMVLVLDRSRATLAIARLRLSSIERAFRF